MGARPTGDDRAGSEGGHQGHYAASGEPQHRADRRRRSARGQRHDVADRVIDLERSGRGSCPWGPAGRPASRARRQPATSGRHGPDHSLVPRHRPRHGWLKLDWTGEGLNSAAARRSAEALTIDGSLPYRFTLAPKDTGVTVASEALATDTVGGSAGRQLRSVALPAAAPRTRRRIWAGASHVADQRDHSGAPRATGTVN